MAHIDPLLERNRHFATTNARGGASILAKYPLYVISCLDSRTGADFRRGGVRMSTSPAPEGC